MTGDRLERDALAWLWGPPGDAIRRYRGRSSETGRAVEALVDIARRDRLGLGEEWSA